MASFPFDECIVIPNEFNFEEIIRKKIEAGLDDEPLYIGDVSDILEKHKIWSEYFPRITPFYATKCNDSPVVIRTLAALGTGFDCASKTEILNVLSFGVPPERIIFAQPAKLKSHVQCAADNGIKWITFDNDAELHKTKKLYPTAELLLRFRCDSSMAAVKLGDKFGCDPHAEAPRLIQLAKSLNLNLIGISFHVGSNCSDPTTYAEAIAVARNLFDIGKSVGYEFHLLDIGGGFPGGKYTNIESIASAINCSLDTYFSSSGIKVIAEPGRFFVESAFTLVTHVHSKRKQYKNGVVDSIMYYINDGIYGSFAGVARKNAILSLLDKNKFDESLYKCTIWGPTCCNLDMVRENILLPDLDVDSVIYFENMGAYKLQMGSTFNGFPKAKLEFYIEAKRLKEVKDALSTKT